MTEPNNSDYSVSYIASQADNIRKDEVLWEHRRYEASVAAMQGILSHRICTAPVVANEAVKYADALIEELRKPRNEK